MQLRLLLEHFSTLKQLPAYNIDKVTSILSVFNTSARARATIRFRLSELAGKNSFLLLTCANKVLVTQIKENHSP